MARHFAAGKRAGADEALDADHAEFDHVPVDHSGQQRGDAVFDEVDIRKGRAGFLEHLSLRQRDWPKPAKVPLAFGGRQSSEQAIFMV
jgi:hypothetical protein